MRSRSAWAGERLRRLLSLAVRPRNEVDTEGRPNGEEMIAAEDSTRTMRGARPVTVPVSFETA
jgi:hypothetical protein